MSSSPNDAPTESEDVAHAHRNHEHESPETLAHKTTKKVCVSCVRAACESHASDGCEESRG